MAELKHTFVKGRMNKDIDERLVPNGEYRDALNIQISNSESSDAGAVENILGNIKVSDLGLTNATAIGAEDDKLNKKSPLKIKSIDLHGYTLDQANKFIERFIIKSYEENINKLIVVTGKGLHSQNEKNPYVSKDLGILKHAVPEYVKNNKELMKMINSIQDASIEDGGSGAFYIFLKKKLTK